jgi:hypothetical protein
MILLVGGFLCIVDGVRAQRRALTLIAYFWIAADSFSGKGT